MSSLQALRKHCCIEYRWFGGVYWGRASLTVLSCATKLSIELSLNVMCMVALSSVNIMLETCVIRSAKLPDASLNERSFG